ncbi:MAG: thiamine diphosphokinase [Lachnospiraceae bacterium]|nr:thiamine diphosphokinase [Lachnospiraceae bacterium]
MKNDVRKIAVLVGAAPVGKEMAKLEALLREDVYKIAVDGGIHMFTSLQCTPDYYVGDMDSTKEAADTSYTVGVETKVVPVVKDDTDMALALQEAFTRGIREAWIFGGLGGDRISHSFANVQLMQKFAGQGMKIIMVCEQTACSVLVNGTMDFPETQQGHLSVFSLTDVAKGVRIKGLFYEYEGELHNDYALGVSNHFVGKSASVSVEEGALLIVCEEE